MKKDDIVMVYQDPITCEKPEGEAKLVAKCDFDHEEGVYERWEVEFAGDEGSTFERRINLENHDV